MALAGAAEVCDGVGVVVADAGGVVAGPFEGVPDRTEAFAEGEDEEVEGAPEPAWEPDESWHPVSTRTPPITTITDVLLRPGMASPFFDR